jgi:DNA-binding transcriptional MerR regulator
VNPSFTIGVAARIARVPVTTLVNWRNREILVPSITTSPLAFRYTFRDLVAIRVLAVLRDAGIDLRGLRRVVEYLRQRKALSATDALASTVLITDGHDVYEIDGNTPPMSAFLRPGQGVFHGLVLNTLVAEVQRDARAVLKKSAAA